MGSDMDLTPPITAEQWERLRGLDLDGYDIVLVRSARGGASPGDPPGPRSATGRAPGQARRRLLPATVTAASRLARRRSLLQPLGR